MLSGHMLPIHFPPAPDELLSSWYVRLAHANHLKAETFCTALWGRQHQIWNRDIDRLSPEWLVRDLAIRTGIAFETAWNTTLKSYKGRIFTELRPTGISPWILPVQMYHRKHRWPGLQFCPECLKEDKEPYFRKRWRLALYTMCKRHGTLLSDRCPSCGEPVVFHRRELGKTEELDVKPLSLCYLCNQDLRLVKTVKPATFDLLANDLSVHATEWLENDSIASTSDVSFYTVLHHICKLLLSNRWGKQLRDFIMLQAKVNRKVLDLAFDRSTPLRLFFEHHSVDNRHKLILLAYWLIAEPALRFKDALKSKSIMFNRLYKDFHFMPEWYRVIIRSLPHRDIPKLRKI